MKLEDFLTPEVAKRMAMIDRIRRLIVIGETALCTPLNRPEKKREIAQALFNLRSVLPKLIVDLESYA